MRPETPAGACKLSARAGYAEGGLPEVLGSCGLLVPTGDRAALGDAITLVLEDDAIRRSLADCGRERARTEFRLERMVESILECYREASSPAPPARRVSSTSS